MIVIIDYGMGNLKSISNALNKLGLENKISSEKKDIENAKGLILPGVGAFKDAIYNIKDKKLDEVIINEVLSGKMILGICLGMQLFFKKGFESGEEEGFGFFKGNIVKMKEDKENNIKIPNIGWNNLVYSRKDDILNGVDEGSFVYFVHSYYANGCNNDDIVSYSEHGDNIIPAIVRNKNIIGAQFHPEKSSDVGLKILKNFGELIK